MAEKSNVVPTGDLAKKRREKPRKSEVAPPLIRGDGSPQGSRNLQILESSGSASTDFRPYMIDVSVGEDVLRKIMSHVERGPRSLSVISPTGYVSSFVLRRPGSSSGVIFYEGQFQILSLAGFFTPSEVGGVKTKMGGLTISLVGPHGHVFGGEVAGPLIAGSPIQIVAANLFPHAYKYYKQVKKAKDTPLHIISPSADDNMTRPDE